MTSSTDLKLIQQKKMTQTPVPRLVLQLGLPTTISMLVTNLYNLADTWFVGQINTSASGATGVVFGLMSIIQAVGFMYGMGSGSTISRRLGEQKPEIAKKIASTGFYMCLVTGCLITILGLLFLNPLCRVLGSTDTILPYARTYAVCILLSAPALAISCVMNNILRFEGRALFSMIGLVCGAVLNIFGDALLINVFGLGILGAGISTLVSQYISTGVLLSTFLRKKTVTDFNPANITLTPEIVFPIFAVGFPSLIRQGLSSISTMVLNTNAKVYGDAAVAAMSIVSRLCIFLFCVGIGIGQGFQPVSSYNYGAKLYSRVRQAFRFTYLFCTVFMAFFAVFGFFNAEYLVHLMRDDPEVVAIGVPAMHAQCFALVLMPITLMANMLFQSTGHALQASIVSSMRSGLCFIPTVLLLSHLYGLPGIEVSQAIADIISVVLSLPLLWSFMKKMPKTDGNLPAV